MRLIFIPQESWWSTTNVDNLENGDFKWMRGLGEYFRE